MNLDLQTGDSLFSKLFFSWAQVVFNRVKITTLQLHLDPFRIKTDNVN